MSAFLIASLQLQLYGNNNLEQIEHEVNTVKKNFAGVQMVLLGELALFGPKLQSNYDCPVDTLERLCALAKKNNIWLIPGSLFRNIQGQTFNIAPVIDPQGYIVTEHKKIYPFLPHEQNVSCGDKFIVFDVPGAGRFGICICYDMWFPEVIRSLMSLGAEVILHPTMTNTVDRDVELCIARANAATNQCYLFDINVAGDYGVGRSIICGPGGEVVHQAGVAREIITTNVDFDYIRQVREQGWQGLGQTIKSFRDNSIEFPIYQAGGKNTEFLTSLGPLKK